MTPSARPRNMAQKPYLHTCANVSAGHGAQNAQSEAECECRTWRTECAVRGGAERRSGAYHHALLWCASKSEPYLRGEGGGAGGWRGRGSGESKTSTHSARMVAVSSRGGCAEGGCIAAGSTRRRRTRVQPSHRTVRIASLRRNSPRGTPVDKACVDSVLAVFVILLLPLACGQSGQVSAGASHSNGRTIRRMKRCGCGTSNGNGRKHHQVSV
eukprot:3325956-Rhodomonas_salina.6